MTEDPGTWGLTRKLGTVHYFRHGKCIHPTSPRGGRGWLFVTRENWDPSHPLTCPDCKRLLDQEAAEAANPSNPVKV